MRTIGFLPKLASVVLSAVILSTGLIGVSYAYYTNHSSVLQRVTTGDIDVVFSNTALVPDAGRDPACTVEANITGSGKTLAIDVANAYPGFTAYIDFEITNKGSVPVSFTLSPVYAGAGRPFEILVSGALDYIKRDGGKAYGQITLRAEELPAESNGWRHDTELIFQQAVVEVR